MTEHKPDPKFATLPDRIPLSETSPAKDTSRAPDFDGGKTERDIALHYPV
ncbi:MULTISPECIES: hypothetical protein [unclassified Crossiella]|nr:MULTISPECIES: hypothetical protein [unclassified Crossiella]MCK2238673.1 hypothetical protein [Crossiella sp. S99.2]MCK2251757.1 hypothetical protein [Crossiella sp. S99.1]